MKKISKLITTGLITLTLIIFAGIVGIVIFNNSDKNSLPILEAKITSDNNSGNEIINIYSNGKIKRINSSSGKDFIKPIEVAPQTFDDNTVHITINQRQLKRNKQALSDPIWIKIINYLAKNSQHSIAILNLYKLDDEYYFFLL